MKRCSKCQRDYPKTQRFCLEDGERLSLPDHFRFVGRVIAGGYTVKSLVGVGGMGAVYHAHNTLLDRHLAIKILLPNLALSNQHAQDLFEREAELASRLSHENIGRVAVAGRTQDGISWLAMEWVEGRTLEEELAAHGALSLERAAELLRQTAAALDAAHAAHIIHRDLKPANIMLVRRPGGGEQVKVLDFGIAKSVSSTVGTLVFTLAGTPHYASPEQMSQGSRINGQADIYSLGVMLWQMLTGRLPFQALSLQDLILLHRNASAPPVRTLRPDVPVAIDQLLSRMMAKQPEQRPQSAGEVHTLFRQALDEAAATDLPAEAAAEVCEAVPQNTSGARPYRENSASATVSVAAASSAAPSSKGRFIFPLTSGSKFSRRLLTAACVAALGWGGMSELHRHAPRRITVAGQTEASGLSAPGQFLRERVTAAGQTETAEQAAGTLPPAPAATPAAPESAAPGAGLPRKAVADANQTTPATANSRPMRPRDQDRRSTAAPSPKVPPQPVQVSGGAQHGNAIKRVQPAYPPIAKSVRARGPVEVQVTISEDGRVVEATPISGPPLLRNAAQQAARQWVFEPTLLSGMPVQVKRTLTFNFKLE